METSWQSILNATHKELETISIKLDDNNYRFHAGLGLAGTGVPKAVKEFLSKSHPFTTLSLKSDAYAACLGAHGGQDGAIIIIGTGVIGMRIQGKEMIQVGGWGFPHSDEGSGAWLGIEAVRLTLQAHDGRIEFSPLLRAILQKFDNDFPRFVTWANESHATKLEKKKRSLQQKLILLPYLAWYNLSRIGRKIKNYYKV